MADNWRKNYYQIAINQFKKITGDIDKLPDTLEIPITERKCMFEFGGSKHSSGSAMIVSTASGFPNSAIVLHNRHPNGLHVCSRVWPGTLLGIATHKYGFINIGIYKVENVNNALKKLNNGLSLIEVSLLAGGINIEYTNTIDLRWLMHLEKKYPGIKKLALSTIEKLLDFRCVTPKYIEPFKPLKTITRQDACFSKLLLYTDLMIPESPSSLVPQHVLISSNMKSTLEYSDYISYENDIVNECKNLYELNKPYIYVYLNHLINDNKFITKAFITYQDKDDNLLRFLRKEYIYNHVGYEQNRSYDFESYILNNYNPTYMTLIFGIKSGGISRVINDIEQSKDRCISHALKYSLCTRKYIT